MFFITLFQKLHFALIAFDLPQQAGEHVELRETGILHPKRRARPVPTWPRCSGRWPVPGLPQRPFGLDVGATRRRLHTPIDY
jgi:hypothetical protein